MLSLDASMIYRVPALLLTITVHEYAHGAMSSSLGDPTPELDGRLTMNPLAHLDLIGYLFLCFLAMLLQVVFARYLHAGYGVIYFLDWLMLYNVWFAFFNLLPVPPMDGYRILGELLPYDKAYRYEQLVGRYSTLILIVICFTGIVSRLLTPLANLYLSLCRFVLGVFFL